ncbi:deoxyhypusine hydroxylase, partial [Dimargaris xerosporica]
MASTPTTAASPVHAALEQLLLNTSGKVSLAERFRALFSLKALKDRKSIDIISQGFSDTSALLKHELAYVLGQMGDPHALPVLEQVLRNDHEDPMVRHEAAEAMGAIGDPQSLPILEAYRTYPQPDIAQTCELAVERIHYQTAQAKAPSSDTAK